MAERGCIRKLILVNKKRKCLISGQLFQENRDRILPRKPESLKVCQLVSQFLDRLCQCQRTVLEFDAEYSNLSPLTRNVSRFLLGVLEKVPARPPLGCGSGSGRFGLLSSTKKIIEFASCFDESR